ncbi:aryl hydrocarbon receptor protein 1 isoform X2 [Phlebotomus papatasi]|uniref:aryl hydrocarbon receptor protein 1 isoform X2 n=1 Tax=Phlebotomus papatasi TaxID=29031 RepID=UPI0024837CC5|nr:aryl hydrocarbon receptor protein 1 isoform X2 [Phlebotomus papatasi]
MSQLGTVYATKRRRRNGKSLKPPPKDGVTKSNPSKRHRERLNAELDLLASLLPFEQNILSKLDRLSILRLSVSYLRTKSYFQVVMLKDKEENGMLSHIHSHDSYRSRELGVLEHNLLDGDMFLQALNGFLMILTCEGEVFFATHSIESYLGFHQSDIVHQSVYELVHSEDREELQRQLLWNSFLPPDMAGMSLAEALTPDKCNLLERSFTVRFRCLLDNTSGFLRLDIRGRVKVLHGQNRKTEEPPLALFAYCTPFGPPSLLEIPQKENMFKSKHKLDLSLVSMDQRGKMALGYSDAELANMGGYDLVHFDDLSYVASAHQELLKTGASGMIAYRFQKKDGEWQWLQTSSRLVYKNSKPDFVICTHRQLMEEEGRDLLGKRTMDFKVSYLDTGLSSSYFTEADQIVVPPTGSPNSLPPPVTPQRTNRRYKTQLRDFLSTCRSKRKLQQQSQLGQITPPVPVVEYIPEPTIAVATYPNLNPMYSTSPYPPTPENLYMTPSVHSTNFYSVPENLFHQYRLQGVSGYYPEYHHSPAPSPYVTNGFLPYEGYGLSAKEEKWQESGKYYPGADVTSRSHVYASSYGSPTTPQIIQSNLKTPKSSPPIMDVVSCSSGGPSPVNASSAGLPLNSATPVTNQTTPVSASTTLSTTAPSSNNGIITPKVESSPPEHYERQTVLMWGATGAPQATNRSPNTTPTSNGMYSEAHHLKISNQMAMSPAIEDSHHHHGHHNSHLKWNGSSKDIAYPSIHQPHHESTGLEHPASTMYAQVSQAAGLGHHGAPHIIGNDHSVLHQSPQGHAGAPATPQGGAGVGAQAQTVVGSSCEVWSPASYSQYQYFTYHHAPQHASTQSSLGDTTQSHYLSRNNGYMEHRQRGTISPTSPLTPTHPTRSPITRTGVLCCPSLR